MSAGRHLLWKNKLAVDPVDVSLARFASCNASCEEPCVLERGVWSGAGFKTNPGLIRSSEVEYMLGFQSELIINQSEVNLTQE